MVWGLVQGQEGVDLVAMKLARACTHPTPHFARLALLDCAGATWLVQVQKGPQKNRPGSLKASKKYLLQTALLCPRPATLVQLLPSVWQGTGGACLSCCAHTAEGKAEPGLPRAT